MITDDRIIVTQPMVNCFFGEIKFHFLPQLIDVYRPSVISVIHPHPIVCQQSLGDLEQENKRSVNRLAISYYGTNEEYTAEVSFVCLSVCLSVHQTAKQPIFFCSSTHEKRNKRSGVRLETESETGERRYNYRLAVFHTLYSFE